MPRQLALQDPLFPPNGLFCYVLDRDHLVAGGALTDGGALIDWFGATFGSSQMKKLMQKLNGLDISTDTGISHDLPVCLLIMNINVLTLLVRAQ